MPPNHRRLAAGALLVSVVFACSGKDPYNPGTPLGTYKVTGTLASNSCGDTGTAPDPWLFDVKLARDPSTLFWLQGGPPVSGALDTQTHAKLMTSDTRTVHEADARRGISLCALTREDILDATLATPAAGTAATVDGFTGGLTYRFSATEGSDCGDQLGVAGGGFAALPCTVSYILSARRTPTAK